MPVSSALFQSTPLASLSIVNIGTSFTCFSEFLYFIFTCCPSHPFHPTVVMDQIFSQWNAHGEHCMDHFRYVSSLVFHWLQFWSLGSWQHWTSQWFIWSHHLRQKVVHHYGQCRFYSSSSFWWLWSQAAGWLLLWWWWPCSMASALSQFQQPLPCHSTP